MQERMNRFSFRLPKRVQGQKMGYAYGDYVPAYPKAEKRRLYPVLHDCTQTQRSCFDTDCTGGLYGVSTRRMESLVKRLGIDCMSRSLISEITKGLNEQVEEFRNRPLSGHKYPIIWADALYEKVRAAAKEL